VVWGRSADAIPLSSAHVDLDGPSLSSACSAGAFLELAACADVADNFAGAELLLTLSLPIEDWTHVRRVAMTAARDVSIVTPAIRLSCLTCWLACGCILMSVMFGLSRANIMPTSLRLLRELRDKLPALNATPDLVTKPKRQVKKPSVR